jgi:hypothetical protein
MMLGNVERFEIVIGSFDFRAFDDRKADRAEDAVELFVGLADKMLRAERPRRTRRLFWIAWRGLRGSGAASSTAARPIFSHPAEQASASSR